MRRPIQLSAVLVNGELRAFLSQRPVIELGKVLAGHSGVQIVEVLSYTGHWSKNIDTWTEAEVRWAVRLGHATLVGAGDLQPRRLFI